MAGLFIETKLRPCYILGEHGNKTKALFHCWNHISNVVDASPLIGGHPGGAVAWTAAIVELEDGSITLVHPQNITFMPGIFEDYCWNDEEKEKEN